MLWPVLSSLVFSARLHQAFPFPALSVLLSSESYLQETGMDSGGQGWTPILGERFKIITRNDLITSGTHSEIYFVLTAVTHRVIYVSLLCSVSFKNHQFHLT